MSLLKFLYNEEVTEESVIYVGSMEEVKEHLKKENKILDLHWLSENECEVFWNSQTEVPNRPPSMLGGLEAPPRTELGIKLEPDKYGKYVSLALRKTVRIQSPLTIFLGLLLFGFLWFCFFTEGTSLKIIGFAVFASFVFSSTYRGLNRQDRYNDKQDLFVEFKKFFNGIESNHK